MLMCRPYDGFRPRLRIAFICMLGAIIGTRSSAQIPATQPSPDIVVQAQSEQAIRDFVSSMTDSNRSHQLARWDGEVCPTVIGIDPKQASTMEARIGDVANTLHLKARAKGCLTTMLIIIDNNASAVAASLVTRFSLALRTDEEGRLKRFVASKRPARWISTTNPCGFGGCDSPNSRLRSAERLAFQAMIVIVDGQQIGGLTLAELSDYVAFVALADPPFGKNWPSTSIMSMFDARHLNSDRRHLTENDMAFLRGLYGSQTNGLGQSQRSSIVSRMTKEERSRN